MIGRYAFYNCDSLKTIKLPNSIKTINHAFQNCSSLQKIDLPPSIKTINRGAFSNCSSLETIDIPPSLTTLGERAFDNCGSLEEVIIQGPIPLIRRRTFENCYRLKNVVLPKSILSIEEHAFKNCASLLKINLSNSVKSIHASAFEGCLLIRFENCSVIESVVENGGAHPCDINKYNPWHEAKYGTYRCPSTKFKKGPGAKYGFGGVTQKGYGPEKCGISLDQLMVLKQHPLYHRTGKNGKSDYLMRDFVRLLKLITAGTGMGYSLLINKKNPLKVKVMVSHAWDEPIKDFLEAIEDSGEKGPFWICAMAIYQNGDSEDDYVPEEISITEQLGPDFETGPFATVLKSVSVMIAVVTDVCDINTRLWCVYEMHFAVCQGVSVKLCAYISHHFFLYDGQEPEDIRVAHAAEFSVDSSAARCGKPEEPESLDEITIRKVIGKSVNGFNGVNQSVEKIRLSYLAKYPINDVYHSCRADAICKIKEAIECIIPRINVKKDLKTYAQYLQSRKLNDKDKNFKKWTTYIQDKLRRTK